MPCPSSLITNLSRFYHTRGHYPGPTCPTPPLKEVLTPAIFPSFDAWLVAIALGTSRNLAMSPVILAHAIAQGPTSTGFFLHFSHGSSSRVLAPDLSSNCYSRAYLQQTHLNWP